MYTGGYGHHHDGPLVLFVPFRSDYLPSSSGLRDVSRKTSSTASKTIIELDRKKLAHIFVVERSSDKVTKKVCNW